MTLAIYAAYASIYDLIGQDTFSINSARQVWHWLEQRGQQVERVLDLGCGTGSAVLVFAAYGCRAIGVDRSPEMLAIARAKARDAGCDVTFIQSDMREVWTFSPPPCDLVTCFYDSLNYLTNDGDLEQVFSGVAATLRPGGVFVFDVNSTAEYTTWDERDVVTFDGQGCLVYNRLSFHPDTRLGTGRIVWFVRDDGALWWRGEETHIERAWSDNEISAALAGAGLQIDARLTPAGEPADDEAPRVVYVARRS